jgi:hypothetical protein
MHITNDDDPVFGRRKFNTVSGSELTTGNVAKISNAVADAMATIADLHKRLDRLEKAAAPTAPRLVVESRQ